MKKLSFLFISLLTAFAFTGCTDGLDNIEYNPSNGVILSAPVSAAATSSSLTVTSTMNGNVGVVLKKGFCYSANVQNPTIKDYVVDADENFSATITGLMGGTTYYIRAYVYGDSRYVYSETFMSTMEGTTGQKSTQYYYGLNNMDSNNLEFMLSVDGCHLVF